MVVAITVVVKQVEMLSSRRAQALAERHRIVERGIRGRALGMFQSYRAAFIQVTVGMRNVLLLLLLLHGAHGQRRYSSSLIKINGRRGRCLNLLQLGQDV